MKHKLIKSPRKAYLYAKDVLHRRWPEAEKYILRSNEWSFWYARNVIQGRWPELEAQIYDDPCEAYNYAVAIMMCIVTQGRWRKAEPYIAKSGYYAHLYAIYVIRGRWKRAEPSIASMHDCYNYYIAVFRDQILSDLANPKHRLTPIDRIVIREIANAV